MSLTILFAALTYFNPSFHLFAVAVKTSQVVSNSNSKLPSENITLGVISWNLAEKIVPHIKFLKDFRDSYDIVAIGVQECEDIRPRREEGRRSRRLRMLQRKGLGKDFKCIVQSKLGGIQLSVYAKHNASKAIKSIEVIDVACGIGNVLVNKGAICALLRINGKTLALVNSHLAAHQNKVYIHIFS